MEIFNKIWCPIQIRRGIIVNTIPAHIVNPSFYLMKIPMHAYLW